MTGFFFASCAFRDMTGGFFCVLRVPYQVSDIFPTNDQGACLYEQALNPVQ